MGIQICIEFDVLKAAGWEISIESDTYWEYDEEGNEVEKPYTFAVIKKGDYNFSSYSDDCFFADCNDRGHNKHLFKVAGLLDLEHSLG